MNEKINIRYRTWHTNVIPPRRIKLEIPGWAGDPHSNRPQPWHCEPWKDASTYGLELLYPFDAEMKVHADSFEGDFSQEIQWNRTGAPFSRFSPGHYGFTSSVDISIPEDYVVRIEPHPRFFTDETGTCPIAVPGHIQNWWNRIFFIVFKNPTPGQTHVFRKHEPYAQLLIVPRKINYDIQQMPAAEAAARSLREAAIAEGGVAKKSWKDYKGNNFDDKYKQLLSAYNKGGDEAVSDCLQQAKNKKQVKRIGKFYNVLPKKAQT